MEKQEFIKLVTDSIGEERLNDSGAVLYSSLKTIIRNPTPEGRLYFMGINPGGNPVKNDYPSVKKHLDELSEIKNEYIAVKWIKDKPGESTMQRRVQEFFLKLGYDLNSIPSSNLVFKRSINTLRLNDFKGLAAKCWTIHLKLINELDIKVIISNSIGKYSPYDFIKTKGSIFGEVKQESGHGKWSIGHYNIKIDEKTIKVISIPHLSRYSLSDKETQLEIIKTWI